MLFKFLLFLLAGAIINVAVAWGCAFRRQSVVPRPPEPYITDKWIDAHLRKSHDIRTRRAGACAGLLVEQFDAGVSLRPNTSPISTPVAERLTSGWPALALRG